MWVEIWAFPIIIYTYNNLQSARHLCYKQSVVFSLCISLSQSPCLENKVFAVSLALCIMVLLLIAFRKIYLLLHELYRSTKIFQWAASSPLAQMPTQIFLYHAGGTKKLWNLLFPRIYLKKKKSTGSIHSQSSPRPLRGRRCFPSLDLATKGRKWKRNISGSFSRIYQKLKALFPLFFLPTIPQDRYSLYSQQNTEKIWLLIILYLSKFYLLYQSRSDQSLSCVRLFATP